MDIGRNFSTLRSCSLFLGFSSVDDLAGDVGWDTNDDE